METGITLINQSSETVYLGETVSTYAYEWLIVIRMLLNMSLYTFTYQTTYTVVYTLYDFLELFYCFLWNCYKTLLNIYDKCTSEEQQYITRNAQILKSVPTHITVILANEKPSYKDLSKLILWCVASGITYLSFYDYKGILKDSEEKLQRAVEEQQRNNAHVIWHNKNCYKNGFIEKKIYVRTLSYTDGRENIVNVAKKLCEDDSVKHIDIATVDKNIKDKYVFPDPDLCLYCGKSLFLYGYPPWEIRLTEFISIKTHHSISPRTFINALYRYSKTEMRLGR
ncbi:hypothetical protein PPYR_04058 [Photinus pyralis]|uniref:ditrans,polycis-polyprenyl diphosphate synthase [(2E,6E)-farnesyldiphosphate specific] n=1 Tax=Photinus pyralis TaxID=7054 RepID=A0A1Y1KV15_PHOPY|nr:dehydrodolichyl diphosphate synthase complex subunit nus1 [Photinus pyralis]KAB0801872.1 hypothetical protein PPYR_04058 [Photinus pyralis]